MDLYLACRIGHAVISSSFNQPQPLNSTDSITEEAQAMSAPATVRTWQPAEITQTTKVNSKTYDMLCLAEDAIRYTHCVLPKGSSNQAEHHEGDLDNNGLPEAIYLQTQVKIASQVLMQQFPPPTGLLRYGLVTGIARYYGGGNCGIHAGVAMNYLLEHAPTGTKIEFCKLNEDETVLGGDHEYLRLVYPGAKTVVCDPYPANHPQAVLCEDYFISSNKVTVMSEVNVSKTGINMMKEYYALLEKQHISPFGTPLMPKEKFSQRALDAFREAYNGNDATVFRGIASTKDSQTHEYQTTVNCREVKCLSEYRAGLYQQAMEIENPVSAIFAPRKSCTLF